MPTKVEVDPLVEVDGVAVSPGLPVAGDAGLHEQALALVGVVLGDLPGEGGPGAHDGDPFCQDENAFFRWSGGIFRESAHARAEIFPRESGFETHLPSDGKSDPRRLLPPRNHRNQDSYYRPIDRVSQWDVPCKHPRVTIKMPRETTERSRSRIAVPPCFFGSPIRGPSLPYGNGILDRQESYDNL